VSVFIVGLAVSSFSCMRLQKGALSEISDRRFPFGLTVKETDERCPSFMVTFVGGSGFELVFSCYQCLFFICKRDFVCYLCVGFQVGCFQKRVSRRVI
jgi:hypothetical protein